MRYYVTFFFKNIFHFVNFTAEQIANEMLGDGEDIMHYLFDKENRHFMTVIHDDSGKEYDVTFGYNDPRFFNVFTKSENDEEDGILVEKNIPWQVVKIVDENTKETVYRITDYI